MFTLVQAAWDQPLMNISAVKIESVLSLRSNSMAGDCAAAVTNAGIENQSKVPRISCCGRPPCVNVANWGSASYSTRTRKSPNMSLIAMHSIGTPTIEKSSMLTTRNPPDGGDVPPIAAALRMHLAW